MRTLIVIFPLLIGTPLTYGASFDCTKAGSHVEKLICSNTELSKLDEKLSIAYAQKQSSSKSKNELKSSQRRWLVEKRNTCADAPCIKKAYETRLNEIDHGQGDSATTMLTATDSVTGTWDRKTSQGTLQTLQVGSNVHFELEIYSSAPAYNVGFIDGEFDLHGNIGIFQSTEYEKCKITFTFYPTKVILDSITYNNCGFGHAVYAIGTFYLRSKEKPEFTSDPQM